jgi:hypothetical protein
MPEQRQAAARTQHACRLGRARDRVHPVPGRAGDDRVVVPARGIPLLERRHLNLHASGPREAGHPRVGLDAQHRAARSLELPGLDAGAAADVEEVRSWAGGEDTSH